MAQHLAAGQRGQSQQHAPSEAEYSEYTPTPSEIDAYVTAGQRVRRWTNDVHATAPRPSGSRPGKSVGAGSAIWHPPPGVSPSPSAAGARMTRSTSLQATVPQPLVRPPLLPRSSSALHAPRPSLPQRPASTSSLRRRGPPVPLLAQQPTHDPPAPGVVIDLPRGDNLIRTPTTPRGRMLRSENSMREAYLASALDFPLEMIAEVMPGTQRGPSPQSRRSSSFQLGTSQSHQSLKSLTGAAPVQPATTALPLLHSTTAVSSERRRSQPPLSRAPPLYTPPEKALPSTPHPRHDVLLRRPGSSEYTSSHPSSAYAPTASTGNAPLLPATVPIIHSAPLPVPVVHQNGQTPLLTPPPSTEGSRETINPAELGKRTSSRVRHMSLPNGASPPTVTPRVALRVPSLQALKPVIDTSEPSATVQRTQAQAQTQVQLTQPPVARLPCPSEAPARPDWDAGDVPEAVVFSPHGPQITGFRDAGDHVSFQVPAERKGRLRISLSWLPLRGRRASAAAAAPPAVPTQAPQPPVVQPPVVQPPVVHPALVQQPLFQQPLVQRPLLPQPLLQQPLPQQPLLPPYQPQPKLPLLQALPAQPQALPPQAESLPSTSSTQSSSTQSSFPSSAGALASRRRSRRADAAPFPGLNWYGALPDVPEGQQSATKPAQSGMAPLLSQVPTRTTTPGILGHAAGAVTQPPIVPPAIPLKPDILPLIGSMPTAPDNANHPGAADILPHAPVMPQMMPNLGMPQDHTLNATGGMPGGIPPGMSNGLPSAMPNGIPNGLPSNLPTSLPNSILSGLSGGMPSIPGMMPGGIPGAMPVVIPGALPSGMPGSLPTHTSKALPSLPPGAAMPGAGLPPGAMGGIHRPPSQSTGSGSSDGLTPRLSMPDVGMPFGPELLPSIGGVGVPVGAVGYASIPAMGYAPANMYSYGAMGMPMAGIPMQAGVPMPGWQGFHPPSSPPSTAGRHSHSHHRSRSRSRSRSRERPGSLPPKAPMASAGGMRPGPHGQGQAPQKATLPLQRLHNVAPSGSTDQTDRWWRQLPLNWKGGVPGAAFAAAAAAAASGRSRSSGGRRAVAEQLRKQPPKSQKELDRQRRAARRDEREKRMSMSVPEKPSANTKGKTTTTTTKHGKAASGASTRASNASSNGKART